MAPYHHFPSEASPLDRAPSQPGFSSAPASPSACLLALNCGLRCFLKVSQRRGGLDASSLRSSSTERNEKQRRSRPFLCLCDSHVRNAVGWSRVINISFPGSANFAQDPNTGGFWDISTTFPLMRSRTCRAPHPLLSTWEQLTSERFEQRSCYRTGLWWVTNPEEPIRGGTQISRWPRQHRDPRSLLNKAGVSSSYVTPCVLRGIPLREENEGLLQRGGVTSAGATWIPARASSCRNTEPVWNVNTRKHGLYLIFLRLWSEQWSVLSLKWTARHLNFTWEINKYSLINKGLKKRR